MGKKYKEFTREEYEEGFRHPPFSYNEREIERHMKMHDEGREFAKNHPYHLPKNMHQVSFNGFSSDTIDDNIHIECECGEDLGISGGYLSFCPKCGRAYRVISYIVQYEETK
jgi:hypothetical protein